MSDQKQEKAGQGNEPGRPTTDRSDELHVDDGPLKQHGDALHDGSGSRQGQSPPKVKGPGRG